MKMMDDFRERADALRADLNEHGKSISAAVETNTAAIALVAAVSVLALIVGVTALRRATR